MPERSLPASPRLSPELLARAEAGWDRFLALDDVDEPLPQEENEA